MSRFLRMLIAITVVMHIPVIPAVYAAAEMLKLPLPGLIAGVYVAAGLFFFLGRAKAGMPDHRRPSWLVWLVDVPYFVHWCACLWTLLGSILVIFTLSAKAFLVLYALGLMLAGYGVLVRRRFFVEREIEVKVEGLDPRFDGYLVAHLSDLHIGSVTPRSWGERWVRAANARKPDLTVVTGDMVTSGTDFHEDIADVVGGLAARDGVFVSMGNHDYFGEGEPLISLLRARGVHVLRNEGTVLEKEGAKIFLTAIDDTWTGRADLAKALEQRIPGVPTILLAHDPDRFPQAVEREVELVLSGHTHGGQVAVPFLGKHLSLSHLNHKFHVGLYRLGRSALFVHPGLGTTGPPIRLGVAPAVCFLRLRVAP